MKINLERFTQETEAIAPIVGGWGKIQGRRVEVKTEDGWYKVLLGNQVTILKKATQLEVFKTLRGMSKKLVYAVGTEGVPVNFDNFFRRGLGESVEIHFMNAQLLDMIEVVEWEDQRFYYYETVLKKQREIISGAKNAFEEKRALPEMRGLTPEIRYAFLLAEIARESYEAFSQIEKLWTLSSGELNKRVESIRSNFQYVITGAIAKAGGTYIGHKPAGSGYIVEWEVGGQKIKSKVTPDLRIISAGFCLSGEDKKHSLGSVINLAKLFQENRPLYITRE